MTSKVTKDKKLPTKPAGYIRRLPQYFLIIMTAFLTAGVFYYTVGLSKSFVNTDVFDTLLWAKASYDSGKIISSDFYYSALLPFGGSLLMLPFIAVFGFGFTAHVIGLVLFEIIFIVCFVLFFKRIGFNSNWIMLALSANFILWLCSEKFREMFLEHIIYYSLSALFMLIGFMLAESFIKNLDSGSKKRIIISGAAMFTFFVLTATDGFQIIGLATLPVAGALVLERFFDTKTKLFSKQNKNEIITVVITGAATVIGLFAAKLIINGVQSEYASEFSKYDTNEFIYMYPQRIKNFIDCWYQLFQVFFISRTNFTDLKQIPVLITAAFATMLLAAVPVSALFYRKAQSRQFKRIFWAAFLTNAVTLAIWLLGTVADVHWRLIPAVYSSFILLLAGIYEMYKNAETKRFSVTALILIFCMLPSVFNYLLAYTPQKGYATYTVPITKIEEKGITHGYSNYWDAGAINVFTSEKIKTVFVKVYSDRKICIYNYQQNKYIHDSSFEDEPTFLILKKEESEIFEQTDTYRQTENLITDRYETGGQYGYVMYFYSKDIYGTVIDLQGRTVNQ